MKEIKYFYNNSINTGTDDEPNWIDNLIGKRMPYTEANEEIAKTEAYKGEYTIEEIEIDEPVAEPTADEILNAMLGVNRYA